MKKFLDGNINLIILPKFDKSIYNVVVSAKFLILLLIFCFSVFLLNLVFFKNYFGLRSEVNTQIAKLKNYERLAKEIDELTQYTTAIEKDLQTISQLNHKIQKFTNADNPNTEIDFREEVEKRLPSRNLPQEIETLRDKIIFLQQETSIKKEQFFTTEKTFQKRANVLNHIPSIKPARGNVVSTFGYRIHPITGSFEFHEGLDIDANYGMPVYAAADGVVEFADWHYGYGLSLRINHGNGFSTLYAHNSNIIVRTGEKVKKGQIISLVGATGSTTGAHLHYEVRYNNKVVNPINYLHLTIKDAGRFR